MISRKVTRIYNNNNKLIDTFCGKNLGILLLNIVVRIVTSWLQMVYSTWYPDGVNVCDITTFDCNGVYSLLVPCTWYAWTKHDYVDSIICCILKVFQPSTPWNPLHALEPPPLPPPPPPLVFLLNVCCHQVLQTVLRVDSCVQYWRPPSGVGCGEETSKASVLLLAKKKEGIGWGKWSICS